MQKKRKNARRENTWMHMNVHDDRFLRLIRKFLNSGDMEAKQLHASYSGTAQGGIISPMY